MSPSRTGPRPARPRRIVVGIVLLLLVLGSGLQLSLNLANFAEAVRGCSGSVIDLLVSGILLVAGLWLVWTGLPREGRSDGSPR